MKLLELTSKWIKFNEQLDISSRRADGYEHTEYLKAQINKIESDYIIELQEIFNQSVDLHKLLTNQSK